MTQVKLRTVTTEWRSRSRQRRLASDRRAGAWSGAKALRTRYDFMRRAWWLVLFWPAVAAAAAPAVLLAPGPVRGFLFGVVCASGLWGAVYVVATSSGAAPAFMGQMGEQLTAGELRRLRRRGWRLINGVHFRAWDIDHVLIGPGGAVVAETKFSANGWSPSRYTDQVIADARDRAKRNANDLRLNLGKSLLTERVFPVVVLWGGGVTEADAKEGDGVRVLPGSALRAWLAELPDVGLDEQAVAALYDKLAQQVERRDRHDLEREGPSPRTVSDSLTLLGATTVVGLLAFWSEIEILRLVGWAWVIPVGAAFAAAQLPFRRSAWTRPWRIGWLAGSQMVTALISLAYVVELARHFL